MISGQSREERRPREKQEKKKCGGYSKHADDDSLLRQKAKD